MVRLTPAIPCCGTCVLQAADRAGFNYNGAFMVVSGLEELEPAAMTKFMESMVTSTGAKAFLFVETPLAALPELSADELVEGEEFSEASTDEGEPEGSN